MGNTREVNGTAVVQKENSAGVLKDHVPVAIGTSEVESPRWRRNPLTDRTHDLTKLSDDGYLKPFLALLYKTGTEDYVDLSSAPVLSFDADRWEWEEQDGQLVVQKREPETRFEEMVVGDG